MYYFSQELLVHLFMVRVQSFASLNVVGTSHCIKFDSYLLCFFSIHQFLSLCDEVGILTSLNSVVSPSDAMSNISTSSSSESVTPLSFYSSDNSLTFRSLSSLTGNLMPILMSKETGVTGISSKITLCEITFSSSGSYSL